MQDSRPRFLQLISFSNLSMPENLVMMSPYSVYPYRLWGRVKKPQWGGEGSFRHMYVAFRFGAKKKNKTKNKTKQKAKKKKKKKKKVFRGSQQGCILLCSFYAQIKFCIKGSSTSTGFKRWIFKNRVNKIINKICYLAI